MVPGRLDHEVEPSRRDLYPYKGDPRGAPPATRDRRGQMAPEDQTAGLDQAQDRPSPSTSELCETSLRSKPPPVVLLLRPPELTETEAQRNVQVTLRQRPPPQPPAKKWKVQVARCDGSVTGWSQQDGRVLALRALFGPASLGPAQDPPARPSVPSRVLQRPLGPAAIPTCSLEGVTPKNVLHP